MNTLTIKLPFKLDDELSRLAQREHLSKSEVVRQDLSAYVHERNNLAPASAALDALLAAEPEAPAPALTS